MTFSPKKILVPVAIDPEDDIELANHAIDVAADIAKKFGATVVLLHLAPVLAPGGTAGVDVSGKIYRTITLVLQANLTRGRMQLKEMKERLTAMNIPAESIVLDSFEPMASMICDKAHEVHADLIVLGSHGRKGFKRMFLGSVAERVVHISPLPVLLVHFKPEQDS